MVSWAAGIGVQITLEPRLKDKLEFSRQTGSGSTFQAEGTACVMTRVRSLLSAPRTLDGPRAPGGEADAFKH